MALNRKEYDQLATNAQVQLTGASENGIKLTLYEVMKEFFTDSGAWMEDILVTPAANVQDYIVAAAQEGQIIRMIGLFDPLGIPIPAFLLSDFKTLHLLHAPQVSSTTPSTMRVEKTVTQPTTESNLPIAPDWTLRVHSTHILDGVLGQMMMQPNKSYSDPTKAAYHLKRFRAGITIARTQAKRANGVGNQAWAYPQQTIAKGSQRGGVSTAWPTRAF